MIFNEIVSSEVFVNENSFKTSHSHNMFGLFDFGVYIHSLSPETFRTDDSIRGHLVSSPSFARKTRVANDGLDTRWPQIESSLLNVSDLV